MLLDWLNQDGCKASWADIVAALVKIKMGGLAKRLSSKYGEWMGMNIVTLYHCYRSVIRVYLYITGVPMPPEDETSQAAQQRSGSSLSEVYSCACYTVRAQVLFSLVSLTHSTGVSVH